MTLAFVELQGCQQASKRECGACRGISGLRVGWMHTLNGDLIAALDSLAYFAMPSTIIQEAATQMLTDKAFVTSYLAENQRRLARSYDALTGLSSVGHIATCTMLLDAKRLQSEAAC